MSTQLDLTRTELADAVWRSMPILLVALDTGVVAMASEQAAVLFGYVREDMVGLRADELVILNVRSIHAARREERARHPVQYLEGSNDVDVNGRRKDGTLFPVAIQLCPIVAQGTKCTLVFVSGRPSDYAGENKS